MTPSEKLIWAAAFARAMSRAVEDGPPSHVMRAEQDDRTDKLSGEGPWAQWELDQAANAAEWAGYCVEHARDALARVADSYGEDSGTYRKLAEMVDP